MSGAAVETAASAAPPTEPVAPAAPEPSWRDTLSPELKADKTLERYKTVADLAKGTVEKEKMLGRAIFLPAKDAKPEDITKAKTETMAKLRAAGLLETAPATPADYQYQRPETALDSWDTEAEQNFLTEAHAMGLTPTQLQRVMNWYGGYTSGVIKAQQAEAQQVAAQLKNEYGPNYDANLGRANRAISEFGGEPLIDLFAKTGMGRHPLVVQAFVKIGNALVEHGAMDGSGMTGIGVEDAQARMDAMIKDKTHAFNNPKHPDYAQAAEEFLALQRIVGRRR